MLVFLVALTSLPRIEKDVDCTVVGNCYPTEAQLDTTTATIVWTNYTSCFVKYQMELFEKQEEKFLILYDKLR